MNKRDIRMEIIVKECRDIQVIMIEKFMTGMVMVKFLYLVEKRSSFLIHDVKKFNRIIINNLFVKIIYLFIYF